MHIYGKGLWFALTINDHPLLHEILVDEGADFALVGAAQFRGGTENLECPVSLVLVAILRNVAQVDPVLEQVADGLGFVTWNKS